MSALDPRWTRWLVWSAPFALLAIAIGLQTGWGAELRRAPPPDVPVVPAPVATAVMPEYRIDGGLDAMRATVDRPLFNATRKPAPVLVAEAPKPTIQRGQYVLTGTMITDKAAIAFLKDAAGGKSRSVKKGDAISGMVVTEVKPDRVRLALGDETEDIELKVQKGPKTTVAVAPEPPPQAQAAAAAAAGQPTKGGAVTQPAPARRAGRGSQGAAGAPGSDAAENLRQNRRNARATEGQRGGAADAAQAPPPTTNMDNTYRNMQRRQR